MKFYKYFFLLMVINQLMACSGISVSQDYKQGYDFSSLKTFAWEAENSGAYGVKDNELLDKRIRKAMVEQLSIKSYVFVESGTPDFFISYNLTVKQKISSNNVSGGVSFGRGGNGRYGSVGLNTGTNVYSYNQGTLLIDITDAKDGELIWRGNSTQSIADHSSPDETTDVINETVEKMLMQFPPPK